MVGGECNLCGAKACEHKDGDPGEVVCSHWIVSADLQEVSLVPRPAQPMARIHKVGVRRETLEAVLGPQGWETGMEASCDKCLAACRGVREYDPQLSPAENGL